MRFQRLGNILAAMSCTESQYDFAVLGSTRVWRLARVAKVPHKTERKLKIGGYLYLFLRYKVTHVKVGSGVIGSGDGLL